MRLLAVLFLAVGGLFVGLRVFEQLMDGAIGEVSIGGTILWLPDLPLLPIGLVALALGATILWRRARAHG
jgi:hypothetical protein